MTELDNAEIQQAAFRLKYCPTLPDTTILYAVAVSTMVIDTDSLHDEVIFPHNIPPLNAANWE